MVFNEVPQEESKFPCFLGLFCFFICSLLGELKIHRFAPENYASCNIVPLFPSYFRKFSLVSTTKILSSPCSLKTQGGPLQPPNLPLIQFEMFMETHLALLKRLHVFFYKTLSVLAQFLSFLYKNMCNAKLKTCIPRAKNITFKSKLLHKQWKAKETEMCLSVFLLCS